MRKVTALSFSKIFFLMPFFAYSDYRVYQYIVTSPLPDKTNQSNIINSSLDPVAFQEYYAQMPPADINLLRTWKCKGNTSKRSLCLPPEVEKP